MFYESNYKYRQKRMFLSIYRCIHRWKHTCIEEITGFSLYADFKFKKREHLQLTEWTKLKDFFKLTFQSYSAIRELDKYKV